MSEEILRAVQSKVSKDCWKKLKMFSISKEINMEELIRSVLEKFTSTNKKVDSLLEDVG